MKSLAETVYPQWEGKHRKWTVTPEVNSSTFTEVFRLLVCRILDRFQLNSWFNFNSFPFICIVSINSQQILCKFGSRKTWSVWQSSRVGSQKERQTTSLDSAQPRHPHHQSHGGLKIGPASSDSDRHEQRLKLTISVWHESKQMGGWVK